MDVRGLRNDESGVTDHATALGQPIQPNLWHSCNSLYFKPSPRENRPPNFRTALRITTEKSNNREYLITMRLPLSYHKVTNTSEDLNKIMWSMKFQLTPNPIHLGASTHHSFRETTPTFRLVRSSSCRTLRNHFKIYKCLSAFPRAHATALLCCLYFLVDPIFR